MPFCRLIAAFSPALLCACAPAVSDAPAASLQPAAETNQQTQIARGHAFVAAKCSGCHAVEPGIAPPNPQAPGFVAVANEMDFTPERLREFFLDGHDDPFAMTILLEEDEAEIATAYIMSLRTP